MIEIKDYIKSYKQFMGIDTFPQFTIEYFNIGLNHGYESAAKTEYDFQTKAQKLLIPSYPEYYPTFLIYHELTHIFDAYTYSNGDKNHDCCLTGYMEYHASQIELMYLRGAKTIEDKPSFSLHDLSNRHNLTVRQLLDEKYKAATELISRSKKQDRSDGVGVLFNYFGLKSICNMFATDYNDDRDYSDIVSRMSSFLWMEMRNHMTGWVVDIERAVALYSNVYLALV